MQASQELHKPVLLSEVMEYFSIDPQGIYLDATFGRGGHAKQILAQLGEGGRLLAIDQDQQAVEYAKQVIQDERFTMLQGSFAMLEQLLRPQQVLGKVQGLLLDLGVSSPQLDQAERGFSFMRDGPLDMRMDQSQSVSAEVWLASAEQAEIIKVLKEYGEERFAKRIATAIIAAREENPITRTGQLAEIISQAVPFREPGKHPATRSFQAIRIYVNQELKAVQDVLQQAVDSLAVGGRLLVISFHSLEDRIVKRFMQQQSKPGYVPFNLPVLPDQIPPARLKIIAKKVKASQQECLTNPRARSAVLRVAEKLA